MRATKLLFTAPLDFDPEVAKLYRNLTGKSPFSDNLKSTRHVEVWVCDPNQMYVIDDFVLALFPRLRVLATPSTGTNHIDLEACNKRGVKVISLLDDREGLNEISASSEFTFKLILDALRLNPPRELRDRTVGLVGYGRIGKNISRWCLSFGVSECLINDPYTDPPFISSLEEIFTESDVVVICCSLTPETKGMIGKELISCMKRGAALVNTARGDVINEEELIETMVLRPDIRVALDVVHGEETGTHNRHRLRDLGAIVTNHIAGETYDSRTKAAKIIYNLIKDELN